MNLTYQNRVSGTFDSLEDLSDFAELGAVVQFDLFGFECRRWRVAVLFLTTSAHSMQSLAMTLNQGLSTMTFYIVLSIC